jgi:hypothetical protein
MKAFVFLSVLAIASVNFGAAYAADSYAFEYQAVSASPRSAGLKPLVMVARIEDLQKRNAAGAKAAKPGG